MLVAMLSSCWFRKFQADESCRIVSVFRLRRKGLMLGAVWASASVPLTAECWSPAVDRNTVTKKRITNGNQKFSFVDSISHYHIPFCAYVCVALEDIRRGQCGSRESAAPKKGDVPYAIHL